MPVYCLLFSHHTQTKQFHKRRINFTKISHNHLLLKNPTYFTFRTITPQSRNSNTIKNSTTHKHNPQTIHRPLPKTQHSKRSQIDSNNPKPITKIQNRIASHKSHPFSSYYTLLDFKTHPLGRSL